MRRGQDHGDACYLTLDYSINEVCMTLTDNSPLRFEIETRFE